MNTYPNKYLPDTSVCGRPWAARARFFCGLAVSVALAAASSLSAQTWNGGGGDGNTGTAENWVDSELPEASGADVIFAGSTNTNVNNDYLTQLNSLTFASGAASFVIGGNSLSPFPVAASIYNLSTNKQTIALGFTTSGGQNSYVELQGVAGSHTLISGNIGGTGSVSFNRSGDSSIVPVFELSGTNSFRIARITWSTILFSSEDSLPTDQIAINNNAAAIDNTSGGLITTDVDLRIAGNGKFLGSNDFTTTGDFILTYNNGTRNMTFDGATFKVGRLSRPGTVDGLFTKLGAGTFEIDGAAAADVLGDFRISAGTVRIGHKNALGYGTLILGDGAIESSADLSGENAVANAVEISGATTIGGGQNLTFAGTISDATTPGASITINSGATVEFLGDNTYSANTQVNAGTLLINGDQSLATGDVNVASGAVLGGSGIIGGATTISGSLRPGNSIGTLTVANDVTWNSGQDWGFELGEGNTSDMLDISDGALLRGTGDLFQFDFLNTGEVGVFTLITWTSLDDLGGGAPGTNFVIEDFSYVNLDDSLSGSFVFSGTSLQFVIVPEPGTVALLMGACALLVLIRRRK